MGIEAELAYFNQDEQISYFRVEAHIHTPERDIPVHKVISFDTIADFDLAFSDRVILSTLVLAEHIAKDILPHRHNLEMSIVRISSQLTRVTRYKAVIPEPILAAINPDLLLGGARYALDLVPPIQLELHGKYLFAEALATIYLGGNYLNVRLDQMLSKTIKHYSDKVKLPTGPSLGQTVIAPINNQTVQKQILVPSGTSLIRLPFHLQKNYGLYTSELGSYLRPFEDGTKVWWIFPQFGNIEPNASQVSIRAICAPKANSLTAIKSRVAHNTLQREGNVLIILAEKLDEGGQLDARPVARANLVNVVNTKTTLSSPCEYAPGKVVVSPSQRFQSIEVYPRADQASVATGYRHSANLYTATAAVLASTMQTYSFKWTNGDQALLVPGMQVEVLMDQQDEIKSLKGRLASFHSVVENITRGNQSDPSFQETVFFNIHVRTTQ